MIMLNREIAERLALLMENVNPFDLPSVGEVIDAIHATEADLENGGCETLQILRDIIADYPDDEDIVASATELINMINN